MWSKHHVFILNTCYMVKYYIINILKLKALYTCELKIILD